MDAILIQFLIGLYIAATSVDGNLKHPSIHWVKLIIGVVLIVISHFGINLLSWAM